MEEIKRESYVLGYNVIKFNVVHLNSISKSRKYNPQTLRVQCRPVT
jgi:hypothetical protein